MSNRNFEFDEYSDQPYRMDGEIVMTEFRGEIESISDVIDAIICETKDAESLETDVLAAIDAWGLAFDREEAQEKAHVAAMAYRMAELGA